jgi:hypothetical protein
MGTIDHELLFRLLTRSEEVAAEPDMKPTVALVYHDVVEKPAQAYLTASEQVKEADSAYAEKLAAANQALEALDAPYREARSVIAAYAPLLKQPATLKAQPTDTDQLNAIKELTKEIAKFSGKPWADQIQSGAFGQLAPAATTALDESIAANKARTAAHHRRAATFEPAYEAFLRFKQVVHDGLGSKSKQYQRLRVRRGAAKLTDETQQTAATAPAGTSTTTTGDTTAGGATPGSSTS